MPKIFGYLGRPGWSSCLLCLLAPDVCVGSRLGRDSDEDGRSHSSLLCLSLSLARSLLFCLTLSSSLSALPFKKESRTRFFVAEFHHLMKYLHQFILKYFRKQKRKKLFQIHDKCQEVPSYKN